MNQPSNDLFDIIKKLTPQEKTFFKAYFLKTKDENYTPSFLILFDALNELETYDRQKLTSLLNKKGFDSNFFKAQTYLTEAILKALVEYYSETDKGIRISLQLQQAGILLNKNLHRIAQKYFDRAKSAAVENTMHEYYLLLDHLEFSFHRKEESWMNTYLKQVDSHLKIFQKETELRKLGADALMLTIEHYDKHAEGPAFRKKVKSVLNNLNKVGSKVSLNNFSRSRFYNAKVQCLMILGDRNGLDKTSKEYFQYLKTLPNNSAFFAKTVLHGLNSVLIGHVHSKQYANIETIYFYAEKYFRSLPKKICTPDISSLFFSYIAENMLAYYNETGQPEKTLEVWSTHKKEIAGFNKQNVAALYDINVAYAEFLSGNYHQAVRLANSIELNPARPAVYAEARLLQVLAHYELGNYDILPALARTARRFYEKSGMLKEPEKLFFTFIEKKVQKILSRTDEKKMLLQLKHDFLLLQKRSSHSTTAGSINLALWLESRITGTPFAKLIAGNRGKD